MAAKDSTLAGTVIGVATVRGYVPPGKEALMARTQLPAPIEVPWTMKPIESAETRLETLDDGRLKLWIRHEVIHGVTPEMLVWWFQHIEGEMEIEGKSYPRYRVWHPLDHVGFRYAKSTPGAIGPGAVFHIHEAFARNPEWTIDVLTDVVRLDEGGFRHMPRQHGVHAAVMDYTFKRVPGGTLYENSLVVGFPSRMAAPLNALIRRVAFPDDKGVAWLRHNVEEVGNFEFFLPQLYAKEHGRAAIQFAAA